MPVTLRVTTDRPGDNACVIDVRAEGHVAEVHFTASPTGGPEAMWFCFGIEPALDPPPTEIRCVLHFIGNLLGGDAEQAGFHPVFKTARRNWTRVRTVDVHELPDGQPLVSWTVPGDEGPVDVALTYPYGLAELDKLVDDTADVFRRDFIGVTQQNRMLPRISNHPGSKTAKKPGIYCLARQHAGETPGSWMLDGFLRQIATAGEAAPLVWAAPLADFDGVCAGHYGKDSFPWDFNRAWGSRHFPEALRLEHGSHPMRHEVHCLQNDLHRWHQRCQPMLVLDFHAPTMQGQGIYLYLRQLDEAGRSDAEHQPWIDAFQAALDETTISQRFARSGRYQSRWNTARLGDFITEALNVPQVTFEVPYASAGELIFTRETYQQAGASAARAVIDRACHLLPTLAP